MRGMGERRGFKSSVKALHLWHKAIGVELGTVELAWIIHNPQREEVTSMKSLAYAAGYEKHSVFEQVFVMSIAAVPYNKNAFDDE